MIQMTIAYAAQRQFEKIVVPAVVTQKNRLVYEYEKKVRCFKRNLAVDGIKYRAERKKEDIKRSVKEIKKSLKEKGIGLFARA